MAQVPLRASGAVAATVLAILTLGMFYVLQDYGPASSIRRFHAALAEKNLGELQAVTIDKIDTPDAVRFLHFLYPAVKDKIPYTVAREDGTSKQVEAAVVYSLPNGQRSAMIWVVVRDRKIWKVDISKTLTLVESSRGF